MKLFEKIPASFFSILASPNRELYWTALVTLHHLLEYDLNIPIEDYCIALGDKLSEAYTAKPERLLQDSYLQDSREVLLYMLQNRLRLEQEALPEE